MVTSEELAIDTSKPMTQPKPDSKNRIRGLFQTQSNGNREINNK